MEIGGTFTTKLGDIAQLTGQDNCNTWAAVMSRMLKALGMFDITVDGIKPKTEDTPEVFSAYDQQDNSAATAILQVVSEDILLQLSEYEPSHEMCIS